MTAKIYYLDRKEWSGPVPEEVKARIREMRAKQGNTKPAIDRVLAELRKEREEREK